MNIYKKIKIGDLILIQKGTPIWSIKLQQTIVLFNDIVAKIINTTTSEDSIFVIPQIKNSNLYYLDFSYDKNFEIIPNNSTDTYRDDTIFGELHYKFDENEFINNDRKLKLNNCL